MCGQCRSGVFLLRISTRFFTWVILGVDMDWPLFHFLKSTRMRMFLKITVKLTNFHPSKVPFEYRVYTAFKNFVFSEHCSSQDQVTYIISTQFRKTDRKNRKWNLLRDRLRDRLSDDIDERHLWTPCISLKCGILHCGFPDRQTVEKLTVTMNGVRRSRVEFCYRTNKANKNYHAQEAFCCQRKCDFTFIIVESLFIDKLCHLDTVLFGRQILCWQKTFFSDKFYFSIFAWVFMLWFCFCQLFFSPGTFWIFFFEKSMLWAPRLRWVT